MWAKILVALLLAYNARADTEDQTTPCEKITNKKECDDDVDCKWADVGTCEYDDTKATASTLGHFQHSFPQQGYGAPPQQHGAHSQIDGNTCRKFPYTCRPEKYDTKSIEPPANIPYCQRIPCPVADEKQRYRSQNNMGACMANPGCFYDKELAYYRRAYGNSLYPDVPVCHLAIRNQVFLEHARKYAAQYPSGWNPLLTNCLMETYHDEIYGDTPGCYIANILNYFGYRPRIAGWKGINKYECHAIDGCWMPSGSCAYPVEGKSAEFRPFEAQSAPEQPRTISHDPYEVYNRIPCHRFRNLYKHDDFLDTYHQCMASGCLVDPYIQNYYPSHMYNLTLTLPSHIQSIFWRGVQSNEIRADNYKQMFYQYMTHYAQKNHQSRHPYTPYRNPFSPYLQTQHPYTTQGATPYSIPSDFTFGSQTHNNQGGYYGNQGGYYGNQGGYYGQQGYGQQQGGYYGQGQYGGSHYNQQVRCPYVPMKYQKGYPVLKGSFKGCCERSMCYSPSGNVHASLLTSYFSHWASWTRCNATCGGGVQSRTRACVGQLSQSCPSKTETKECNIHECPVWGPWSEYGDCSVTCGSGLQSRSRSCERGQCYGARVENIRCDTGTLCPPSRYPQPNPFPNGQPGYQYYPAPGGNIHTQTGYQYQGSQSGYPGGQTGYPGYPGGQTGYPGGQYGYTG